MKRFCVLFACGYLALLNADGTTFEKDRLTSFFDDFLCKEKEELAQIGLSSSCPPTKHVLPLPPPPPPTPPPNPFYEHWQDGHTTAKLSNGTPLGLPGNTYNFYGIELNFSFCF
jgi:hypothetical protein